MVNSTKFLSRFKIDFIGIKHWGVDCFAIQAKRSPPTLSDRLVFDHYDEQLYKDLKAHQDARVAEM